jgi:WD40 repeat protein
MRSDWRNGIVDLTLELDKDDDGPLSIPTSSGPSKPSTPGLTIPSNVATPAARPNVSRTAKTPRNPYIGVNSPNSQIRNIATKPKGSSHTSSAAGSSSLEWNNTTAGSYGFVPIGVHEGAHGIDASDREMKRRKMSTLVGQRHTQTSNSSASDAMQARPGFTPSRLVDSNISTNTMNKIPSVQYMNAALKTNGATTSMLHKIASSGPRPLQIGRTSVAGSSGIPVGSPATGRQASTTTTDRSPLVSNDPRRTYKRGAVKGNKSDRCAEQHALQNDIQDNLAVQVTSEDISVSTEPISRNTYFSGAVSLPQDDRDTVVSDALVSADETEPWNHNRATANNQTSSPAVSAQNLAARQPTRAKFTSQFSEEEEHLLIFLKEVKKLQWKQITPEFQKYFPSRVYTALQSRYSTKTNKRDRTQDPAVLKLPLQWAGEAVIDWPSVHADHPGPRDSLKSANLRRDTSIFAGTAPRPVIARQPTEPDYSSGTDSGIRQIRPRRAPPVNYDVRRRNRRFGNMVDETDHDEVLVGASPDIDTPTRSESPSDAHVVLLKAHVVINNPLDMNFDSVDAGIALNAEQWLRDQPSQKLPYLDTSQRSLLQNVPESWEWDQLSSRDWQGMLLHVDFSPREVAQVERTIANICKTPLEPRHSTQKRQLRMLLKAMTDSKLLQLAHALQRRLPARERDDIAGFLRDAKAGKLTETPQIVRLSAARPQKAFSMVQTESTLGMLRQREMGLQSRRGWSTASKSVTYQARNKVMDTLGPIASWTGASSDIHTVAWSQDGECFAAGAVAVTDQDSMQYNRPNNLLFGSLPDATIHELAEHNTDREKTETGANSSHAMFASQDPKLYTTVTSVAFAPSGKVMYSAGYDEFVCVWDLGSASSPPSLASKFKHKAEVEMMAVNRNHAGILATGAKRTSGSAVKLIHLEEDNPSEFAKHNFHSAKAISRSDLRILPTALHFEPRYGELLLAGFGANVRQDNGFDTTGDICLWDITAQTQIKIHGSNRNVFDIEFNPNKRYMPLFAAGCVAGSNVNRGARSVIRFYEERTPDKYTCPLEIECKALDMNDIVWSPQDEHLIAAGCTDGCVYVWDMRRSDDPLRVLCHGWSLMPLQDGVPHERTDTGVRFLSWGDNATRLYSGSSDGVVKVWDVTRSEDDTFVKDLITVDSGIMAGAFSPDFSKLVLGEVNGSVNVLDVGRGDCTVKDVGKLRYVPYEGEDCDYDSITGDPIDSATADDSGVTEGRSLIRSQQLHIAPMGNLPTHQVLQGPNYAGPYDQGVDAPYLRQQALEFQLSLLASQPGPQCSIPTCKDNIVKVTGEEIGDSGRSADRIPNDLRRQWTAIDASTKIMPGKSKCTHCGRPARPFSSNHGSDDAILCERCSFACFRCAAVNAVAPTTETIVCNSCLGVWEIGALGYECIEQPALRGITLNVPSLKRFGRDILEDEIDIGRTTHGDEVNALTDYYHSLAIDRPESPPL